MNGMASKKTAPYGQGRSAKSVRNNLSKSDCDGHPTSNPTQSAFAYVSNTEDIIIREKASTVWRLLILGGLVALGTSIAVYRESNALRSIPIVLLGLPWLQLLAMAAVWLWVRDRALPDVWIRSRSQNYKQKLKHE